MSSTISTQEIQTLSVMTKAEKFKHEKSSRLVRSSSIEKIRRFNTYLCTQHYYIIPAVLAWLKSSQDVLHTSAEKTIFFFRAVILTTIFSRLVQADYKALSFRNLYESASASLDSFKLYIYQEYQRSQIETKFLKFLVYSFATVLGVQLALCVTVILTTQVPYGLIFLLACCGYINLLYYRTTFFFMATSLRGRNNKKTQ